MTTHFDETPLWRLSTAQRAELAQRLWDSVSADTYAAPFTPEQLAEINRRIAEADADRSPGQPASDVHAELAHMV